jgi:hypothetical protein
MPVGKDVLIIKNIIVFIRHMQPKTDILCGGVVVVEWFWLWLLNSELVVEQWAGCGMVGCG